MKKVIFQILILFSTNIFCMEIAQIGPETFELFSQLPKDLRFEILRQKLIDLIKYCLKDRGSEYYKTTIFFESMNNLSLVNKEFNKFVKKYLPANNTGKIWLGATPLLDDILIVL